MRVIKKILILLIIFISNPAYCCDCKDLGPLESLRLISFKNSELVFLGELIEFDTSDYSFTFQIIEIFKGKSKTKLIKGKSFDSCSQFPTDKSKWIIYANYRESDYIDISNCLASRSELNPICIGCYTIPPPLSSNAMEFEITESNKKFNDLLDKAKTDWNTEIELLRKREIK